MQDLCLNETLTLQNINKIYTSQRTIWMNLLNNTKGPHPADVWQQMLRIHHPYRATFTFTRASETHKNYIDNIHPAPTDCGRSAKKQNASHPMIRIWQQSLLPNAMAPNTSARKPIRPQRRKSSLMTGTRRPALSASTPFYHFTLLPCRNYTQIRTGTKKQERLTENEQQNFGKCFPYRLTLFLSVSSLFSERRRSSRPFSLRRWNCTVNTHTHFKMRIRLAANCNIMARGGDK